MKLLIALKVRVLSWNGIVWVYFLLFKHILGSVFVLEMKLLGCLWNRCKQDLTPYLNHIHNTGYFTIFNRTRLSSILTNLCLMVSTGVQPLLGPYGTKKKTETDQRTRGRRRGCLASKEIEIRKSQQPSSYQFISIA